jgi:hypothetical protein
MDAGSKEQKRFFQFIFTQFSADFCVKIKGRLSPPLFYCFAIFSFTLRKSLSVLEACFLLIHNDEISYLAIQNTMKGSLFLSVPLMQVMD